MVSIFFLPDRVLPAPEKGMLGLLSVVAALLLGVGAGVAAAPLGKAAPVLARPERVLPEPTPEKGTGGALAAAAAAASSSAEPGGGRVSKPKNRFPKGTLSAAGT